MDKQVKLLVLSDIHFEKFSGNHQQQFTLNFLNNKINEIKNDGYTPVVVFAGDMHNQDLAYPWMTQVKADIVYIAGNHEFWTGDYYDTLDKLQKNAPQNVNFLHNDFIEVGQYLIIGTTLWTDIGNSLNPDLFTSASSRMNDMTSITAKKWYKSSTNVEKLFLKFSEKEATKMLEQQFWNGIIEREENLNAWTFLSQMSDVLEVLNFAHKVSSSSLYNNDNNNLIDFSNPSLTFSDFLINLTKIDSNFALSNEDVIRLSLNHGIIKERIFQRLRQIKDLPNKEITILSHHLPFYEELFIGQHRLKGEKAQSFLNDIQYQNFFVREGKEYPEENLLYRSSKGEISKKNDITHIINYFNNGNYYLPQYLKSKVDLWIHGHEHLFNYSDFLKGFQIVSNTAGIIFSRLSLEDGIEHPKLNHFFIEYHKISSDELPKHINDLKESLVRIPTTTSTKEEQLAMVHIWAMKNFDWNNYYKNLDRMMQACSEIINASLEYSNIEISNIPTEEKNSQIKKLEELSNQYIDIYNQNLYKHDKLLHNYALAIRARIDPEFSIQKYFNMLQIDNKTYYAHLLGSVPPLLIISDFIGMFTGGLAFKNMEYILLIQQQMNNISKFVESLDIYESTNISKGYIKEFLALSGLKNDKLQTKTVQESIDKKWMSFLNNLSTTQANNYNINIDDEDV